MSGQDLIDMPISGAKGGKGGGGKTRTAKEDPNTLRSNARARIIDMLGEGPIGGLVDGPKSIFLDDTPLQNEDGSYNFEGVTIHTREGYPEQTHIEGFPAVETERPVDAELRHDTPLVRTISNLDVDAVRFKLMIPTLTRQDTENGDLLEHHVTVAMDIKPSNGPWMERYRDAIQGKTISRYQREYRIELEGEGPWEIRMRRISEDSELSSIRNQTHWSSFTEIIDSKLTYPDSALIGLEINARQFGTNIPSRAFDVYGKIISVPSNYNPYTREYRGLWNGTFKQAWTDNPAWVLYDLLTNTRYGAGIQYADKWTLYQIGRYCDELVPDGYGGKEPRFTFNTVMTDRREAYVAIQELASVFRGMTFWSSNQVMPIADMPKDAVKLVSPANVINGEFEYAGSSLKNRHSVALVSWNDPETNYEPAVEVVEDSDAVQKIGWKKTELTAVACTSRGQAMRVGKWVLDSERHETETVTYQAALDHADVRPGDIIKVADPNYAAARMSGRLRPIDSQHMELDAVPDNYQDSTWYLDVVMPNQSIERRKVVRFDGRRVALDQPLSQVPVDNCMWLLSSQDLEPRQFRVMAVEESDDLTYSITGLEYDPYKFARVEQGIKAPPPNYTDLPSGPVAPPMDITVETYTYLSGGVQHQGMTISWTASDDPRVERYQVEVIGPSHLNWKQVYLAEGVTTELYDIEWGEWMVRVRGLTATGRTTPWSMRTTQVEGLLVPLPPLSVDVRVSTFSVTLIPEAVQPNAQFEFWRSTVALLESHIESNAILAGIGSSLTDQGLKPLTQYYYWVRGVNPYGKSDWYPVQARTDGNAEDVLKVLEGKINESHLYKEMKENIEKIPELERGAEDTKELIKLRSDLLLVKQDAMGAAQKVEELARIENDEALASRMESVQAVLDDDFAAVTETTKALVKKTGEIGAEHTLKLDVNGYVSGIGSYNDGTTSRFAIRADEFYMVNPNSDEADLIFYVDSELGLVIKEGFIGPISVGKLRTEEGAPLTTIEGKVRADAIDVDNLDVKRAATFYDNVFSDNYVPNKAGWAILQSGRVEFNEATIRGNLDIRSVTVNGSLPTETSVMYGSAFAKEQTQVADNVTSNTLAWDTTRLLPNMPRGASIDLSVYPRVGTYYYLKAFNPGGNHRVMHFNAHAKVRVWVGNTLVINEYQYLAQVDEVSDYKWVTGGVFNEHHTGTAVKTVKHPLWDIGIHKLYTLPEYHESVPVRCRVELYLAVTHKPEHWGATIHALSESGNFFIGEVSRLG